MAFGFNRDTAAQDNARLSSPAAGTRPLRGRDKGNLLSRSLSTGASAVQPEAGEQSSQLRRRERVGNADPPKTRLSREWDALHPPARSITDAALIPPGARATACD